MKTEDAFVSQPLNTVTAVPFAALCVLLPFCGTFWQTLARGSILSASYVKSLCITLYVQWLLCVPLGVTFKDSAFSPCCYLRVCMDNSIFETVEEIMYLGTILSNRNSIQEELKSRLKSRNACCRSVQNFLSSSLLSTKIKI